MNGSPGRKAPVRLLLAAGLFLLLFRPAVAASFDDRCGWEVVTVEGRLVPPRFHGRLDQLVLLRAVNGVLEPVPLQLDERDDDGRLALPNGPAATHDETPNVLDDNDLLVFAARDLGDRARVDDAAEIEVTDPTTGATRWAYLRYGSPAVAASHDDVRYDAEHDTVYARRYMLGFGSHTPTLFAFAGADGTPGRNLLDRVKARVTAEIFWGLFAFHRTEDDITSTVLAWKDGPIRVIRRARLSIRLGYGLPEPTIIAEDFLTGDTFEGPVIVRLPFNLRYVFGDLTVRIFLDFDRLDGRLFTAGQAPTLIGCREAFGHVDNVSADWFGMTGPEGTFIHALRVSPTMQGVQRHLYVVADPEPDPPERAAGNCPGVGYTLTDWRTVGRGSHEMGMVIRAFDHFRPGDEQAFLATLDHPLAVEVGTASVPLARQAARTLR